MADILESIVKHLPSKWDTRTPSLEVRRHLLLANSSECSNVEAKFRSTFPTVAPTRVERVESAHLYGMYLLKKAEYGEGVREMDLWHATSVANAMRIIETNLDWRRAQRVKFGQGVSFSPSAKYANVECNRNNPTARVCILCKVLVKKTVGGRSTTQLPMLRADTSTGNRGQVYVKYCDNEFYPEYLVYYNSPPYVPPHRNRYNHFDDRSDHFSLLSVIDDVDFDMSWL